MNGSYRTGEVVFSNWKITKKLGEGSYGKVYEIERSDFGETYHAALKIITVPQSDAELKDALDEGMGQKEAEEYFYSMVQEIVREFALMSKVKGTSHVVGYEDHMVIPHEGKTGWDILIRMEELTPLFSYASGNPLSRRDIIRLGVHICEALEACQKYNIIHRDIKPENIFVSANGDFKLGDFGIARTIEKTVSGLSKKGTYSYMAPEVYRGDEYGFSVDMYSLGVVLYRLLNRNRTPFLPPAPEPITFSGRERALSRRMRGETVEAPYYGEGRLGEIVLKAMAYDPKERYLSPAQMRQELEAVLYSEEEGPAIYPEDEEMLLSESTTVSDVGPDEEGSISVFSGEEIPKEKVQDGAADENVIPDGGDPEGSISVFSKDGRRAAAGGRNGAAKDADGKKEAGDKRSTEKSGIPKPLLWAVPAVLAAVLLLILVLKLAGGSRTGGPLSSGETGTAAGQVSENGGVSEESGQMYADEDGQTAEDGGAVENYMLYGIHGTPHSYDDLGKDFTAEQLEEIEGIRLEDKPWLTDESTGQMYNLSAVPWSFEGIQLAPESWKEMGKLESESGFASGYFGMENDDLANSEDGRAVEKFWKEEIEGKYDFARLEYFDGEMKRPGNYIYLLYRVEDGVLHLCDIGVDGETGELCMEECESCRIVRKGSSFTFTKDGSSITMVPFDMMAEFAPAPEEIPISGYVEEDSGAYEDIAGLSYLYDPDGPLDEKGKGTVYFTDGTRCEGTYDLSTEGRLTLSWKTRRRYYNGRAEEVSDPASITFDYLLIPKYDIVSLTAGGNNYHGGIVLFRDGKEYRYLTDSLAYESGKLSGTAEELDLSSLSDDQVTNLITTQTSMLDELNTAFESHDIAANVDSSSGQVIMDSSVLFDLDVSELSAEGQAYLDGFLDAYASVILSDEYRNYVTKVKVEGHTDSSGSYEHNQELSEARAASVADYCLQRQPELAAYMETVGYASDRLVYDENGNEDAAASRRVVFKFALTPQ